MKAQINEIKRMQHLAGLITESEYLKEYEKTEKELGVFADDEGNMTTTLKKSFGSEKPFGSKLTPAKSMSDEEKQTIDIITQELINKGLLKNFDGDGKPIQAGNGKMYGSAFVKPSLSVGTSYKIPAMIDQIAKLNNLSGRAVKMYKDQFGSF